MSYILGISAFYHDSAAALIKNGEILYAIQEERFTRIKHDSNYPFKSIEFIFNQEKITYSDIDAVVFYDKPIPKFIRLLETFLFNAPKGFKFFRQSMPIWLKEKLFLKSNLIKLIKKSFKDFDGSKLFFAEHHLSHAASAFYPSPFEEAVILTLDGVGEWATSSIAVGKSNKISIKKEIYFPHSLGLLYSAFTYYLGFKVNSGEYKVMGLAPYGKPRFVNLIMSEIIKIFEDGSFFLNQHYFDYMAGQKMTNSAFDKLFGFSARKEGESLTNFHMDIAASIQKVTEIVVLKICRNIKKENPSINNLCLAGGVALNCVVNGILLKEKIFSNIWVQPASGDAGGALGCALQFFYISNKRKVKKNDSMKGSYLGPSYSNNLIEKQLNSLNANYEILKEEELIEKAVIDLLNNKCIGWFHGKMEFGPRALGARSILGNPLDPELQKTLNLKVKFRESFRPFAPSVLIEDVNEWFDLECESPYMQFVANIKNKHLIKSQSSKKYRGISKLNQVRSKIPGVTHVDNSARIQTVNKNNNRLFYKLLTEFKKKSGCGVLVNTSFNIRGEPIVNTPKEAYQCFMGTGLESLSIGSHYLEKEKQICTINYNYKHLYNND
jgi:carbamoyltransferase